jgi:IPT/TIG domain/FG-GAP-like repeat
MKAKNTILTWIGLCSLVIGQSLQAQVPVITSFSPDSGRVGRTVTITGTGFNADSDSDRVFFGGALATVLHATTTSLTVAAPTGSLYGPISVTVTRDGSAGLTGYSSKPFFVLFNANAPVASSSFYLPIGITFPGDHPVDAGIADFDGDGKLDIAVVCMIGDSVNILQGSSIPGAISLFHESKLLTGAAPRGIAIADFDGDRSLDIAVTNSGDGSVSVFRNHPQGAGDILFEAQVNVHTGGTPIGIAVADIDHDGKPDIVVADSTGSQIIVLKNTSTRGSLSFSTYSFPIGLPPLSVAAGDLNNDGLPDLVVTSPRGSTRGQVTFLKNTTTAGTISFSQDLVSTSPLRPFGVAIGDLDLDGFADVVVSDTSGDVYVYRNTSSSTIAMSAPFVVSQGFGQGAVKIADVNSDGRPEILSANSRDGDFSIFQNLTTGPGLSESSFPATTPLNMGAGTGTATMFVADLDGDRHPDLVALISGSDSLGFWPNILTDDYSRASVKALLQGPLITPADTSMATTLASGGYLAAHFGAGKFPVGTVDSVGIEIRTDIAGTSKYYAPAWLMSDGTIRDFVDTNAARVDFGVPPAPFYVVVHHRNHLAVMGANPDTLSGSATPKVYDLTLADSASYGTSPTIHVGTRFCMVAGDADGSGTVDASDRVALWNLRNQSGYSPADCDLSGTIDAADRTIGWNNRNRTAQVP